MLIYRSHIKYCDLNFQSTKILFFQSQDLNIIYPYLKFKISCILRDIPLKLEIENLQSTMAYIKKNQVACNLPNLNLSPMLSISVALSYCKGIALLGADVDGVLLDSFVSRIKNTSIHMPKAIFFVYQQMVVIEERASI